MRMNKVWWAHYDSGSDHEIRDAVDSPGPTWNGPLETFTRARLFLTRVGADEAAALHQRNEVWRSTSKAEILSWRTDEAG